MSGKTQVVLGVAVNLAMELLIQSQKVSLLVQAAQARGDTTLNQEELDAILADRKDAFAKLDDAILEAETAPSDVKTPFDEATGEKPKED